MAGVSHTSSDVTFEGYPQLDSDDDQTTFSGSVSATWTDLVWRLTLSADRAQSPSTYGELVTRDRLRLAFGRNLSERLYAGLSGAFYISKTAGLVQDESSRTWTLGPALRFRLTEDTTIDAGCTFIHEDDRESGRSTDRTKAYVGVTVGWPGEW